MTEDELILLGKWIRKDPYVYVDHGTFTGTEVHLNDFDVAFFDGESFVDILYRLIGAAEGRLERDSG